MIVCYKHLKWYLSYQHFEKSINNLMGLNIGSFKRTGVVGFFGKCKKFRLGWLFWECIRTFGDLGCFF